MKCTKCGRDTVGSNVFCSKCLETMERYPIKPGTVIQLPQRKASPPKKPVSRRKRPSPEQQLLQQRKTIRWLCITLACTIFLLCLSVVLLFHLSKEQEATETIGQNYVTRDTTSR